MASMNPFDLLGDDAEDPSQIAAALPKKIEKAAPVQSAKAGKMPTKPLPPSEAVRESKNASSGGRGGGGRGYSRGGGGRGFNRDYRNNDAPGNENGYSGGGGGGGYRPSEDADGARRGTVVGGFRGGRGGGRRGFPNGRESGDVERPRRSGTGRGNDLKREGGGRGNWGTTEDDVPPVTEEPTTEVEKSPVAEKQGGEDETADASKEVSAEELEKKEAEDKKMTLEEYEKILEEKKKALQATKVEERKVDTKVFESMQQLSNKKNTEEEIFVKLGSDKDKRKDAAEKAKKAVNIHEFLKPAEGDSFRGGYRGRGRGPRGPRGGGGNGGGNQRYGGGPAPVIGDTAQFPSLGK